MQRHLILLYTECLQFVQLPQSVGVVGAAHSPSVVLRVHGHDGGMVFIFRCVPPRKCRPVQNAQVEFLLAHVTAALAHVTAALLLTKLEFQACVKHQDDRYIDIHRVTELWVVIYICEYNLNTLIIALGGNNLSI